MYRKSQMEQSESEQFVTKVTNIPVVNTAWTQACNVYQKTKGSNAIFRASLGLAENSVKTFTETAKPYIEKYQPQIELVNNFACQQLDKLEDKYPVIKKPTEELVSDGKDACHAVIKPALDRVNAVRQYGTDKYNQGKEQVEKVIHFGQGTVNTVKAIGMTTVNKSLETSYGQYVADKVSDALTISEDYVEKYLPASGEDEPIDTEQDEIEMDEYPLGVVTRASKLTTKVRRRLYKRAFTELKNVQMRSMENMQKLNFTVNLIEYAKTNMDSVKEKVGGTIEATQNKVSETWKEINKEEDGELPDTLEGKSIAVARHVTRQMKQSIHTVTSLLPESVQPAAIQERLKDARTFTEDLYQSFRKVEKYEDVPQWVLTQAKERMSYLQETLKFLTEVMVTEPLNWLAIDVDIDNIPMEDPVMDLGCNGHVPHLEVAQYVGYVQQ